MIKRDERVLHPQVSARTALAMASVVVAATLVACGGGSDFGAIEPPNDSETRTADEGAVGTLSQALTGLPDHYELAYHWAPVHIQNVYPSSDGKQDFISAVDYDRNWKALDNWDHLGTHVDSLEAVAYYAVTETTTHWFIYYGFYHPRDWTTSFGLHENDMEGMLVFVRKTSGMGLLEGAITAAHGHLFPYWNPDVAYMALRRSPPRMPRVMRFASGFVPGESHARPWTYQEDQGHGMYHCGEPGESISTSVSVPYIDLSIPVTFSTPNLTNCTSLTADKIYYIPTRGLAERSALPPRGGTRRVRYRLVDATAAAGLFARRFDHTTFADYRDEFPRTLAGDCALLHPNYCQSNAANPLWGWRDKDQSLPVATWGQDPVSLVKSYWFFTTNPTYGPFYTPSSTYLENDFAAGGDMCTVTGVPLANGSAAPSCVKTVCAADSYCCGVSWDSICVAKATSLCGKSCDTCTHDATATGAALSPACSPCAALVCNQDAYCCGNTWDSLCVTEAAVCDFRYEVHQQDAGWLGPCAAGVPCGETGRSRRIEAVRLYDPASGGRICYSVHLQDKGWQPEVCSGRLAGTQNENRRLEGIRIYLRGAPAGHRVCYSAHVQNIGWQSEVCDGVLAGTTGRGLRLESLVVKIDRS